MLAKYKKPIGTNFFVATVLMYTNIISILFYLFRSNTKRSFNMLLNKLCFYLCIVC